MKQCPSARSNEIGIHVMQICVIMVLMLTSCPNSLERALRLSSSGTPPPLVMSTYGIALPANDRVSTILAFTRPFHRPTYSRDCFPQAYQAPFWLGAERSDLASTPHPVRSSPRLASWFQTGVWARYQRCQMRMLVSQGSRQQSLKWLITIRTGSLVVCSRWSAACTDICSERYIAEAVPLGKS